MTALGALLKPDILIQLGFLAIVVLLGAITYFFGYKSSRSSLDEEENESNRNGQQQKSKVKLSNNSRDLKDKKKSKETKPANLPISNLTVKLPEVSVKQSNNSTEKETQLQSQPFQQQSTNKVDKSTNQTKKKQQEANVQKTKSSKKQAKSQETDSQINLVNNEELADLDNKNSDGWITVKDKKKKTQPVEEINSASQIEPVQQPEQLSKSAQSQSQPKIQPQSQQASEELDQPQQIEQVEQIEKITPSEPSIQSVEHNDAPVEVDSWITVKDKKQKKTPIDQASVLNPAQVSNLKQPVSASPSNKKSKSKNKNQTAKIDEIASIEADIQQNEDFAKNKPNSQNQDELIKSEPISVSVPILGEAQKSQVLVSSLNELNTDISEKNNESDWIEAAPKGNKKTSKVKSTQAQTIPTEAISHVKSSSLPKKVTVDLHSSTSNEQTSKLYVASTVATLVAEASSSEPVPSPKTNKKKKDKINLASTASFNPAPSQSTSVVATLSIDQPKNDNNNNIIGANPTSVNTNNKNNKKSSNNEPQGKSDNSAIKSSNKTGSINLNQIKQTNLTESMILIETDYDANKQQTRASNRAESNQSSSESLQDLDVEVDEGWATITSKKKKRTVKREQ